MTREAPEKRNRLLAGLSKEELKRLSPHFELISSTRNESAFEPLTGIISVVTMMRDGAELEAATVGNEGFVGIPVLLGLAKTSRKAFWQVPGASVRLDVDVFRREVERDGRFKQILQRYAEAMIAQLAQSAACNAVHTISQRCARWLLQTHDRVGTDQFSLTHEFLGGMLGVRRAGVSEAASRLSRAGLIRYRQGVIEILNREGLERASCECYEAIQRELSNVLARRLH